ncbi:MAG TPA: VWA domain-containing protein [Blastocatellia bacterium]|nr:VWA domain-containing protein [Blastocatellia bacterium]HMV81940.1 VWA domain-containing protein [Blastocatellia bacterium]HMX24184.1 VWA domain-containing protein [Blastocatellia bacterium]HMY71749.1 VWA domain-containing protein [Blastocatellia bacterium]HMZ16366.1 VWA domain-containing protein [Blastocatellia bacterium]
MRTAFFGSCLTVLMVLVGFSVLAQKQGERKKTQPTEQQDTIKIDTDLVMVPVIVSDRHDLYVPDLRKEEFTLAEDGVKQEIAFFATVKEPFHVVLMLDTSLSTSLQKLKQIQSAAHEFIAQLQGGDRVKIMSFADTVNELCDFTGDRAKLKEAINGVRGGGGTVLYDAMKLALNSLKVVKTNRKAIVILTDGVDWHSHSTTYNDNIDVLEEASVIVYPIRYNTRPEVEAMLRNQNAANLDVIFGGRGGGTSGTTPTTVPGETRVPTRRQGQDDPYRLPIPKIELPPMGGRYPNDRRYPDDPTGNPGGRPDTRRMPDPRDYPDNRRPTNPNDPNDPANSPRMPRDGVDAMLDNAYREADRYLKELASVSGGELYRADTLSDLPDAFARIAGELRNQYLLGYYPTNTARDGKYRKIQVRTSRKDTVVRARPGYRAGEGK